MRIAYLWISNKPITCTHHQINNLLCGSTFFVLLVELLDGIETTEEASVVTGEATAVVIAPFFVFFFFVGGSSNVIPESLLFSIDTLSLSTLFSILLEILFPRPSSGATSEALESSVLSKLGSGFLDLVTLADFLTGGLGTTGDCIDFLFLLPSIILSKIFLEKIKLKFWRINFKLN